MKNIFLLVSIMICFMNGHSQPAKPGSPDLSSVKLSEIKTNTIHSDFGLSIVSDSVYFTSFSDEVNKKSDKKLMAKAFYALYKAGIDDSGKVISQRQPVSEFVANYHYGPASYCAKTGELFVTRSNYTNPQIVYKPFRNEDFNFGIVIMKKNKDKWTVAEEFPNNHTAYSIGQPAINETGDTLVFSSDKPGGYGQTDLYYSVKIDGAWQYPINFGPEINTAGKEEFPFITDHHFNGRFLIFSSNGRSGDGGFDLYYTKFVSDYSEIHHFDPPINSEYDDFGMTIATDKDYGYLTSNRPGTGSDDNYRFTFKRTPVKPVEKPVEKPLILSRALYIYDITSRHPIPGASVMICYNKSYLTDITGRVDSLPCNGSDCKVTANAFGYSEKTKVLLACKNEVAMTRDTIWMKIMENEKILLKNIYYDYDKWNILPDAAKDLDRLVSLMNENPEMKVDLGSHTDERGSEIYNMKLSQLRATSAIEYVVSKGIDLSRIKGTGYGKTQLINKSTPGKKCTPEQDRENRRTEIFIPGFLRSEPVKQEKGDYSNGEPDFSPDDDFIKAHESLAEKEVKAGGTGNDNSLYYLMVNSFKYRSNASEFLKELKSNGYDATILGNYEPFRVGIAHKYFNQAKKSLENLKPKYKGMWIWYK